MDAAMQPQTLFLGEARELACWRHWAGCFALATLVHAGAAMALVDINPVQETHGSGPVAAVTLAEFVAAPPAASASQKRVASVVATQAPSSTANEQSVPDQPPEPTAEVPPPEMTDQPPEDIPEEAPEETQPEETPPEEPTATETSAAGPSAREEAAQSAAPSQQAQQSEGIASEQSSWQGRVNAHLEKHKRYPHKARAQRLEGEARLRFRVDARGRIVSSKMESSTGFFLLDREVQAALRRAQPLPKPPDTISEDQLEMIWLVEFVMR